jgi:hypothetical protein
MARETVESPGRRLEGVNLPVEEVLWQKICDFLGVPEMLKGEDCRILLIGTDPNLTLAQTILRTHPEVKITVVEKNEKVLKEARQSTPKGMSEGDIVPGVFPGVDLSDLPKFHIVIAKHLLHFLSGDEMRETISGVKDILGVEGMFFASAPLLGDWKVRRTLRRLGASFEERGLGGLRGTLFIL